NNLRIAADHGTRLNARADLLRSLSLKGLPVGQTLSIALATRVLQPGASTDTDQLVKELLNRCEMLEVKYGWSFPIRISAALVVNDTSFRERLAIIGGQGNEIGTANLLLWPRGGEIRQRSLQAYNPFGELGSSDTAALRSLLSDKLLPIIDMAAADWR